MTTKWLKEISKERQRQIEKEGYSQSHDDEHGDGSIADAAACYAATSDFLFQPVAVSEAGARITDVWPWHPDSNKKQNHSRKRQLVMAGAMILAELERIERAESTVLPRAKQVENTH